VSGLRILLWYWGRRGAGAQITHALALALRELRGVEVALSISAQSDLHAETVALGLPVDSVPTYASRLGFAAGLPRVPLLARRLRRQAQGFGADAVVSVMTHLWTPLVAPQLRRAGLRYVPAIHDAAPHEGDPALWWEWRLRAELGAAAEAIVFSAAVETAIRRRRPDLPLHRLPLAAPMPIAAVRPAPRAPLPGTRFVHVGRLLPYKGLDLLRDAWPMLRRAEPDATLLVAGAGDVAALAPGLGNLPGVTLRQGWLAEAELLRVIREADAVVLPYREASQSGIVPIAHALGVPVVATGIGGLAEQVRHGVDGELAAMDPSALAAAMLRLCARAYRARLAAGAWESGQRLTDWSNAAARIVALLGASRRAAGPVAPVRAWAQGD
jgi:glycosyltransferase involved in cell wall biosynthesis